MNIAAQPTVEVTPQLKEDLQVLLRAEPLVASLSQTTGIANAIKSLLALGEGPQTVPDSVQTTLKVQWGADLEGSLVQGCDLVEAMRKLLQGKRSEGVTTTLALCTAWLAHATHSSTLGIVDLVDMVRVDPEDLKALRAQEAIHTGLAATLKKDAA